MLLLADTLFGSHLVEWELARQQRKIEQLVEAIGGVNRELHVLERELAFCQMILCLAELKARSERNDLADWLFFSPQIDGEDSLLDSAIEWLVKTRLASIDAWLTESGAYSYRLTPDWKAIAAHLQDRSVAPELISWLEGQPGKNSGSGEELDSSTASHT